MSLNPINSNVGLLSLALACIGVSGCGSEPGTTHPGADGTSSDVGLVEVGVATGHFANGHLTFSAVNAAAQAAPGLQTQGFGSFNQTVASFDNMDTDGVGVLGCSSTQYCAQVGLTNAAGRAMQNVIVEVTDYYNIAPSGQAISWAGPAYSKSDAFASALPDGPTAATVKGAEFADFTSNQRNTSIFKFDIGSATTFDFHVHVYATFPKNTLSGSDFSGNLPNADACATSSFLTSADDAEVIVNLPFAYTLFDLTYDRAVIGSNGYMLLGTSSSLPSLGSSSTNVTLQQFGLPKGFYPFWDDLAYDAGGGVCVATAGTKPNRTYTVTWKSAKIASAQPGKSAFSTEKVTYSVVLEETTDRFQFVYNLPTPGITTLTRGSNATTGLYGVRNGGENAFQFSFNAPSQYISASSSRYPGKPIGSQYPFNP